MKYKKHKRLGFIIAVEETATIKFDENWLMNDFGEEVQLFSGTIVSPGNGGWEIGKKSASWAMEAFEDCGKYAVDIDHEDKMWEVTNVEDGEVYEGGWYVNANGVIDIEWDSICGEEADDIDELLLKLI